MSQSRLPLEAEFTWLVEHPASAEAATEGRLRLHLGGRPVWGTQAAGVEWAWRDLLAGLAASWGWLLDEPRPAVAEEDEIFRWEEAHDLGRYLRGVRLPAIVVAPDGVAPDGQGIAFRVEGGGGVVMSEREAVAALTTLGEAIAARIKACGFVTDRAGIDWRERARPEPTPP